MTREGLCGVTGLGAGGAGQSGERGREDTRLHAGQGGDLKVGEGWGGEDRGLWELGEARKRIWVSGKKAILSYRHWCSPVNPILEF